MKIVIAPDSCKESLSAVEAADLIEAGFRDILPDAGYVKRPPACSLAEALAEAAGNVRMTARNIAATIKLAHEMRP